MYAPEIAQSVLLQPAELSEHQLESVLGQVLTQGIDYADIYLQSLRSEHWSLEDGRVKDGGHSWARGAGIRAVSGEKSGFAYADNIELNALQRSAKAARSIANQGQARQCKVWSSVSAPARYGAEDPFISLTAEQKVLLLKRADMLARAADPRIVEVSCELAATYEVVMILSSDGRLAQDIRPLVRLNVSVIAEQNGRREKGYAGGGARADYGWFAAEDKVALYVDAAVKEALINLEAVEAPAGTMPVVLGPGWPGVLLHEAIGHGLEGDFNRKGTSAFTGRLGDRVAAPGCTVVDDGTLANRRGSLTIDDEGTPTQCTVLIEDGILKNYLQDTLNARLMGLAPTGNGRRESYASLPLPRMTNTYMLNGQHAPEDIIASVDKGLYAVNFAGGQVDITNGKFVFSASEAYLIEKGKITRPVKGATLIGNGPDVLTKVSMIGNDMALDSGIGVCGKEGQSVPVGVGQPTLKIDALTVGGTAAG